MIAFPGNDNCSTCTGTCNCLYERKKITDKSDGLVQLQQSDRMRELEYRSQEPRNRKERRAGRRF